MLESHGLPIRVLADCQSLRGLESRGLPRTWFSSIATCISATSVGHSGWLFTILCPILYPFLHFSHLGGPVRGGFLIIFHFQPRRTLPVSSIDRLHQYPWARTVRAAYSAKSRLSIVSQSCVCLLTISLLPCSLACVWRAC